MIKTLRQQRNQEKNLLQGKEELVHFKDLKGGQCDRRVGTRGGKAGPDLMGSHGPHEGD